MSPLRRRNRTHQPPAGRRGVVVLGAPLGREAWSAGHPLMPAILRTAGLDASLRAAGVAVAEVGDLAIGISGRERDPVTGVVALSQVCVAAEEVRDGVFALLDSADTPLVLGGCCGLLVGVFAALVARHGPSGLAFVDGHFDTYTGKTAPSGDLDEMELGVLLGDGPRALTACTTVTPLLQARHAWVLGARDRTKMLAAGAADPHRRLEQAHVVDDAGIRRHLPAEVGRVAEQALAADPGRFWLHVDLDVLSTSSLRATTDFLPGGLDWDELAALLRPLAQSPALLGVDVTLFDPSGEVVREAAAPIVELLTEVLRP